jgi:hypothetical protein
MAAYSISNEQGTPAVITTTAKTQLQASAATATLTRSAVQDILVGAREQPNTTDCPIVYDAIRSTTTGTSTTITPQPLDSTNRASGTVAWMNFSAEPTGTIILLTLALNQRASQRWVAAPGSELIVPAINLNGVSLRARSTNYASTVAASLIFLE